MSEDTPISMPPESGNEPSPVDPTPDPTAAGPGVVPAPTVQTPAVPTAETPAVPTAETTAPPPPPQYCTVPVGAVPGQGQTPTVPAHPGAVPPAAGGWGPPPGWVPPQAPQGPPTPTPPGWSGGGWSGGGWNGGDWNGGWGQPPMPPGPGGASHQRSRASDRAMRVAVVSLAAVLVAVGGFAVGRAVAPSSSTSTGSPSASQNPSFGIPSFGGNGSNSSGGSGSSGSGNGNSAMSSNVAAKVDPGVVDITTVLGYQNGAAAGTGMVLTSSGVVLTNNHVIAGATSIKATDIGNGKTYTAHVVGYDESSDVSVIQLENASGLKTVTTGDSSSLAQGHAVIAIGNAGGVGGSPTVTSGTVTALNQSITATDDADSNSEQLSGLIETDAELQPGDSGGPLVNSAGRVVGMDTAASSGFSFSSGSSQGFAIPINKALSIAQQIRSGNGSDVVHIGETAFLGVSVQPPASSGSLGEPSGSSAGAVVAGVEPNTAAASAGLTAGDTIDSLDGQTIGSPQALTKAMAQHHPGDSVQIGWTDANGVQHTATAKLTNGPAA